MQDGMWRMVGTTRWVAPTKAEKGKGRKGTAEMGARLVIHPIGPRKVGNSNYGQKVL